MLKNLFARLKWKQDKISYDINASKEFEKQIEDIEK